MKKRFLIVLCAVVLLVAALMPTTALARDELKNTDPDKYYVLIDCDNQFITVFEKDDNGEYTRIVRRMLCTTGREATHEIDPETGEEDLGTPTPSGIWKVGGRERFGKFTSFGGEYARYWTQVVESVFMHSIMFGKRDVNYLKQSAFRNLGNKGSHGCVRLYVEDAKWAYYNLAPGTKVNVSNNEPNQRDIAKKLKHTMSFKEYDEFQKNIYDTPELENMKAWVAVDGAALRKGCGSTGTTIAKMPKDAEVEVLFIGDPWAKIVYDGREGYIRKALITTEQGVMQSKEDADIIKATTWIYSEANDDSDRIVKVTTYTSVKVLEASEDGKWTKINYTGDEGWIQTRYLEKGWGAILE